MTNGEKSLADSIREKYQDLGREDILRVVNGSYIAQRFFGRSGSWFSQKLNHHIKNGKPCEFTPDELATLRLALHTIGMELQGLADDI